MSTELDKDLAVARASAGAAAEIVAAELGRPHQARFKGTVDPVTAVDKAAEEVILASLRSHRPDDGILSEESGGADWQAGRIWIVDPLDGTVNFLHGLPIVAVSVALWEDGTPKVGVVIDVASSAHFFAVEGGGAFVDDVPIEVSNESELVRALIATGFPYDRRERAQAYADLLARVLAGAQGIRRLGSAALDLCWVASGRFDGYWESGLAPWDVAAGLLIVQEAGGLVSDLHGRPYRLGSSGIIAAGPALHPELVELISVGP